VHFAEILGWFSTLCAFGRFLVQWIVSERNKRSVAPRVFWVISLAGAVFFGAYCAYRSQYVLLVGTIVNGAIYGRNLWIDGRPARARLGSTAAALAAVVAIASLVFAGQLSLRSDPNSSTLWVACAVLGQGLWSSRFVIQWYFTERAGTSHFPPIFWWVSLLGNAALLSYAIHLADPIYCVSFLFGPVVQISNLILGSAREKRARPPGDAPAA